MKNQENEVALSKFFQDSDVRTFKRSEVNMAYYNPRGIDSEGVKLLRRSLKNFGCVGGIVINAQTGNTVVGGHQKIAIMDEYHKYPQNDYMIRAEVINVDEKTEKTLNIALNNPNVGGYWDYDKLREMIPDIDYKAAGLSDADLSMIGIDFLLQTEGESQITDELSALNAPLAEEAERMRQMRREQRDAERAERMAETDDNEEDFDDDDDADLSPADWQAAREAREQADRQAKIDHMKEVKQQVREQAQERTQNMDAYVMISFDTWEAKAMFCQRFGYDPYQKFIKGEVFDEQVERVD